MLVFTASSFTAISQKLLALAYQYQVRSCNARSCHWSLYLLSRLPAKLGNLQAWESAENSPESTIHSLLFGARSTDIVYNGFLRCHCVLECLQKFSSRGNEGQSLQTSARSVCGNLDRIKMADAIFSNNSAYIVTQFNN